MPEIANPTQTVIVSCRGRAIVLGRMQERDNLTVLGWHMPVSRQPFRYAISLEKHRFSLHLIRESGVFVVNFLSLSHRDAALAFAKQSGMHADKFAKIEKLEAHSIDCPRLRDAAAFLECRLESEHDLDDHALLIGRVLNSRVLSDRRRLFHLGNGRFDVL